MATTSHREQIDEVVAESADVAAVSPSQEERSTAPGDETRF
jgi:hypothetical protein